jgi:hypothetical protein
MLTRLARLKGDVENRFQRLVCLTRAKPLSFMCRCIKLTISVLVPLLVLIGIDYMNF